MSKHQNHEEDINLGEAYSKAEKFVEEKKQPIMIGIAALLVVVLGGFYYFNSYLPPLQEEAENSAFQAQKAFAIDSFELAMYGNNEFMGFEEIIDNYGATALGNTSKYYMAVSLMRTGQYEDAIDYFNSYSADDHMTKALKLGGIGDCLSQLTDYEGAISSYDKAANAYVNEFSTPIYLKKSGVLSEKIGDYSAAVKAYQRIADDYPNTQEGRDIEKFLANAQAFVQ